jgi:ubiquinone/menaquinone biosynthesis C-methylase UbiE
MPSFDHFDFLAPWYDRFIHSPPDVLFHSLLGENPHRVLDAGGGTGRVSRQLQADDRWIVLADTSLKMLRHAVLAGRYGRVGSATERLPFAAGCFDCVILVDTLHHVQDQRQTLLDLWRVVAPGGRLLVEEPDILRFPVKLIAAGEKLALMRSHFLTGEQIAGLLRGLGAEPVVQHKEHTLWVLADKPPA